MPPSTPFLLLDCRVEPARYRLSSPAGDTTLAPKVMAVLQELAAAHPEVISRDQLITRVWQGNRYVGEKAVTNVIWQLRQALISHGAGDDCIETIRKSGYRLQLTPHWQAAPALSGRAAPDGPEPAPATAVPTTDPADAALPPARPVPAPRWRRPALLALLVAGLGAAGLWLRAPAPPSSLPPAEDLTRAPGAERYPQPSPDGRWLAYVATPPGGQTDLYLMDLADRHAPPRRLSDDPAQEGLPIWAPDGRTLYFLASDRRSGCQVWRLRLDDGSRQALAACEGAVSRQPSLSADGRTLAFLGPDTAPAGRRIQLLDLQQPEATPTAVPCLAPCEAPERDRDAAFSPDGRWLALSRRGGADIERLYLLDRHDGSQRRISEEPQDLRGFSWHPDSRQLLVAARRPGGGELRRYDIPDGSSTLLVRDDLRHPAFAADGRTLYVEQALWRTAIARYHAGERAAQGPVAVLQGLHAYRQPAWSPARQRLAYVSDASGAAELWLAQADGSGSRQLTRLGSAVSQPVWSPDGRQLAFLAVTPGSVGNRLYLLDVADDSEAALPLPRALPTPFAYHGAVAWGCAGQCLLMTAGDVRRASLYRIGLSGGEAELLRAENIRELRSSADGSVYYRSSGSRGIRRLQAGNDGPDPRLDGSREMDSDYGWLVDNDTLYYFRQAEQLELVAQPLIGGSRAANVLLRLPAGRIASDEVPQPLADGSWLLTEQIMVAPDLRRFRYGD